MRRALVAFALFGAAALAAGSLTADEPKKDENKDAKAARREIGKQMKDAHRGEKSPHARTVAELKKDSPDWEQMTKDAKAFAAVSAAFKGADLGYTSPADYISSSAALSKAVGEKDKKAAVEAFTGLTTSCSNCHYANVDKLIRVPNGK